MNNPIKLALTRIKRRIPKKILETVFIKKDNRGYIKPNLDDAITKDVLLPLVLPDCNMVGGRTVEIVLQQSWWEPTTDQLSTDTGRGKYAVYRIPPEVRSGAPIIEVHRTRYPNHFNGAPNRNMVGGVSACDLAKDMINSHTKKDQMIHPIPEVLQGDLVQFQPGYDGHIDWILICRVGYDENLTNMNSSATNLFAELCVNAVKTHIYNETVLDLDAGHVVHGHEIGAFKDVVSRWDDLYDEYADILKRFQGMCMMDIHRLGPILRYSI